MRLPKTTTGFLAVALSACWSGHRALGGVIEFTDPLEWEAAIGDFTTIDFTGFPDGTFITDQYADLGILFTDGADIIRFGPTSFLNDDWGLDGNQSIDLSFVSPQAWIAVDFPGDIQIDLFNGGILFHSSVFIAGGLGNFGGLISSQLFDAVVISDPVFGDVFIDDLHFGVPAPPTLALLALASLFSPRSRRRG